MDPTEAVYALVRTVPRGKVVTYGQVADMVETVAVSARQVGQIMAFCPDDVPWQRVVGAGGHLPIGKRDPKLALRQRELLQREDVGFIDGDTVDMARHQWREPEAMPQAGLFDQE